MLRAIRPLVRLLVRNGVGYPAFASALKQVFLDAAVVELGRAGKKQTDSAVSLLSGVHRRDVRTLARLDPERLAPTQPTSMANAVASRWLTDPHYIDASGQPLELPRTGTRSVESLVGSVSSDVRPRAVIDELVRLGMAAESGDAVRLLAPGFVPRKELAEMAALLADNLHDHAAAATANVEDSRNFLEQAVFSDELTADSARHLQEVASRVWRDSFKTMMREVQQRFEHDRRHAPAGERHCRVRFGGYFYSCDDHDRPV